MPLRPVFEQHGTIRGSASALSAKVGSLYARLGPDWIIAGALFAIAIVLRAVVLTDVPPGLHGDEALTGLRASAILDGTRIGAYDPLHGLGQPAGMEYLTAGFVKLFGNSILTIRLAMALVGAMTIALLYALLLVMANRVVAIIGAALLAVMGWHLYYSRVALPPVSWPFFEVLTCLLLMLALRSRRWWLFALTGCSLGLGVYSYSSYPVFGLASAAFVAYWLITQRAGVTRQLLLQIGLALLVAGTVAIPMLHFIATHEQTYFSYPRAVSIFRSVDYKNAHGVLGHSRVLADAGRDYVRRMVFEGQPDYTDASGTKPILDVLLSVLLAIGILDALWNWRRPVAFLALVMVLIIPWAGILSTDGGVTRRTVGIIPFVVILAALPIAELVRFAQRYASAVVRGVGYCLAVGAICSVAGLDLHAYFVEFRDSPDTRFVFAPELVTAADYLHALPGQPFVYFYSDRWSFDYSTRAYLSPGLAGTDRSSQFGSYNFDANRSMDVVFLFLGNYVGQLDKVAQQYPGGTALENTQFEAYELSRVEGATPVPTPGPTPQPTSAVAGQVFDGKRSQDLANIQQALEAYRQAHGAYPDTGGPIETLCAHDVDAGCKLRETLNPLPTDPLDDPATNGYWYRSDGVSYTVFAQRMSDAVPACGEQPEPLGRFASLICVGSP